MKRLLLAIVVVLSVAGPLAAQSTTLDPDLAFPTQAGRRAADIASWGTVLTAIALDTKASWDAPDRHRAFLLQGARIGATYAASQLTKHFVGRTRPCAGLPEGCGHDAPDESFYSMHTAFAGQAVGGPRLAFTFPLLIGTGELRAAAGKHELTDVIVGGFAGWLAGRFIR
jgi:hypothetical protein